MKLVKQKCQRKGYENYWDYYLIWLYQDKFYSMRVAPRFDSDLKLLFASAELVPMDTSLEDYLLAPCKS